MCFQKVEETVSKYFLSPLNHSEKTTNCLKENGNIKQDNQKIK